MLTLALADHTTLTAATVLMVWGLGYGAVPVTFQTWILDAASEDTEAATSLYVSAFKVNPGIRSLDGASAARTATRGRPWFDAVG